MNVCKGKMYFSCPELKNEANSEGLKNTAFALMATRGWFKSEPVPGAHL